MKRPDTTETAAKDSCGLTDEGFVKKYPNISAYLMDDKWDDGKARECSSLAFSVKDGTWQLALNDKALKTSMYTSAPTMDSCLKTLEKALADHVQAWRSWKKGK
jgi:hypothetical protein